MKKKTERSRLIPRLRLKKLERNHRTSISLLFAGIIFFFFVVSIGVITGVIFLLTNLGVFDVSGSMPQIKGLILLATLGSIALGTVMAFAVGRIPLKPINKIINALNRLARGKFKTNLSIEGPWGKLPAMRELCDSFNRLAEELQNTEMLRDDFVNNFSHEFKTPIVSIAGFAGLLKYGNLTEEQQMEYITIIEEESRRLSVMATNVLNLTRIENQKILTGATDFNVSEQIRNCVLLLEGKWSKKGLGLSLNFDEYTVHGNEEMLKQVWINLLDNAIKFSEPEGTLAVDVRSEEGELSVSVTNDGKEIPEANRERIFRKFYQGDESHAGQGNGIGLTIVKAIVELHDGIVGVTCAGGKNTFTVNLPAEGNE